MAVSIEELARVEVALAGAVLVVASLAFSPITAAVIARLAPRDAARRLGKVPPWGWKQVIPVFLLFLAAFGLPFQGVGQGTGAENAHSEPSRAVYLELTALITGAIAILAALLALGSGPGARRALGLYWEGNARSLGVGVLAYFVSLPGILGLLHMTPWVLTRLGLSLEDPGYAQLFSSVHGARLLGLVLLAVLVQPLFEEVLFRGFLQPVLVARAGTAQGIGITSALFASLHGPSFLPIFGLSVLLGGLAHRTGRLASCVAVHALHNALQLSQLLVAAGGEGAAGLLRLPTT